MNYNNLKRFLVGLLIPVLMITMTGCSGEDVDNNTLKSSQQVAEKTEENKELPPLNKPDVKLDKESTIQSSDGLEKLKFKGEPYAVVNNNKPEFSKKELSLDDGYENYPNLDNLGRCKTVIAKVGPETMPTEERKGIGMIKPTGWHTIRYDNLISDKYLYNRCHLIGFQLAGENANKNNLITGTRYLNVEGMLPFEDEVANYVQSTGNHVIYKVSPIYKGNNLVSSGVQMQAYSVEDKGKGVSFNIYCFNVQPGIIIDYATGDSRESGEKISENNVTKNNSSSSSDSDYNVKKEYVVNTNTGKYHDSSCKSVKSMKGKNKKLMKASKKTLESQGYKPCGNCQK